MSDTIDCAEAIKELIDEFSPNLISRIYVSKYLKEEDQIYMLPDNICMMSEAAYIKLVELSKLYCKEGEITHETFRGIPIIRQRDEQQV